LQIPLRTLSTVEAYIANEEWRDACLPRCPLHPSGGCSFARHGSYARLNPPGVRVARWYCPEGHQTFSLLPDFLAAKLPGLLESIEDVVTTAFSAKSMEAAADALRGFDVSLPSALRWLHRRVRAVKAVVDAVSRLVLERPNSIVMWDSVARIDLGQHVLLGLRRSLSPQFLNSLPAPLGFRLSIRTDLQHDMGPDGELAALYDTPAEVVPAPCDTVCSIQSSRTPPPPRRTCFASGARTAASKTAPPAYTFSGSGASAPTAHNAIWMNAPN
jgi:hypothetical protein